MLGTDPTRQQVRDTHGLAAGELHNYADELQRCLCSMSDHSAAPVLSVQMVVAHPIVSAADRWRTRLLSASMRLTL